MRSKILVGIFLVMLPSVAAFTVPAVKSRNRVLVTQAKGPGQVQLEVIQLPTDGGTIPVAIQEEKISVNPDTGMMEALFLVRNNTSKNIDAISVAVSGNVDRNGQHYSSTGYLTRNSLVHPDLREIHHQTSLGPGQEWSFTTEPLDPEAGEVLRGIVLQIDYVDFEDKTWLGPNKYGSNIVTKARTGAAKYKEWLKRKYVENGRSVKALLPLLDRGQPLPSEIDLGDHERTGARSYQIHVLKAYRHGGPAEVEKYLNR